MNGNKALRIVFVVIAAVFLFHQVYSSWYSPITTQNAISYTATDGTNAEATIIRQEQVITSDIGGALHFKTSDGNRLAKGGVVAEVYDVDTASITVSKIDELNKKIADIEEIEGYNDVAAADLELLTNKIRESFGDYVYGCSANNFSSASADCNEVLSAINKKQYITGETVDFSAQLASLKSQLAEISASLPTVKATITTDRSGYFISAVDGYENKLKGENLDEITPEFLKELKPDKVSENSIGKIVSDYDWYIAVSVSLNDSLKYKEGDELYIKTSVRNNPSLSVRVKQINTSKESDSATVIFSCQQMNSSLATMRSGKVTIVNKEYTGLKVPKKALRIVDGETGVYVITGVTVKFVKVNVIYQADDYIICEQSKIDSDEIIRLYDKVIVKGKGLYDGKIID